MKALQIASQSDIEAVQQYIGKLPIENGQSFEVTVKKKRIRRTVPQNNLFHLWCKCISDETGEFPERIKKHFKELFLGYEEVEVFGNITKELRETKKLNTLQMSKFMNEVQAWTASELGIVLPIPEDLVFSQFLEMYNDR